MTNPGKPEVLNEKGRQTTSTLKFVFLLDSFRVTKDLREGSQNLAAFSYIQYIHVHGPLEESCRNFIPTLQELVGINLYHFKFGVLGRPPRLKVSNSKSFGRSRHKKVPSMRGQRNFTWHPCDSRRISAFSHFSCNSSGFSYKHKQSSLNISHNHKFYLAHLHVFSCFQIRCPGVTSRNLFGAASAMNGTFKVGTAETRKVGPAAQGRCDSRRQLRGWANLAFRRDHFRDKPFSNIQIRYCITLCILCIYIYVYIYIYMYTYVEHTFFIFSSNKSMLIYKEIMGQHFTAFSKFNIF